jgi:hypothetical protein
MWRSKSHLDEDRPGRALMSATLDTGIPHAARIYHDVLGGKDNFQADRGAFQADRGAGGATEQSRPDAISRSPDAKAG